MAANEGKSEPAIPAFAKLLHIEVDPSTPNRVSARSCRRLLSIIRPLALALKVKRLETHFMTKTKISLGRIADDAPDAKTPSAVAGTDGAQTEQVRMPVRLRRVSGHSAEDGRRTSTWATRRRYPECMPERDLVAQAAGGAAHNLHRSHRSTNRRLRRR
jgi:hypothetical protein